MSKSDRGIQMIDDIWQRLEALEQANNDLRGENYDSLYPILSEGRTAINEALNALYDKAMDIIDDRDREIQKLQMFLDEVSASNNIEENNNLQRQNRIELLEDYLRKALDTFENIHYMHSCKYAPCEECIYFNEKLNHAVCEDGATFEWRYAKQIKELLEGADKDETTNS